MQAGLRTQGEKYGRKRIERLMHVAGRVGVQPSPGWAGDNWRNQGRPARARPRRSQLHCVSVRPALGVRNPGCADGCEPLYLGVMPDDSSSKIVGWSIASHRLAKPVLDAMAAAVCQRRPGNVSHHRDRRSQSMPVAPWNRCGKAGVWLSVGSASYGDDCEFAMLPVGPDPAYE